MRAEAYQRSDPARCCMRGPGAPSIINCGSEATLVAKKKSGPCPLQAVPSFNSFESKVAVMAFCSPGELDLVSSMSCVAVSLSTAKAREQNRLSAIPIARARLHMAQHYTRVERLRREEIDEQAKEAISNVSRYFP